MLRFDKLTLKAQEALQGAQEVASRHGQQELEPLHLLSALLAQREGIVAPLLGKMGVRADSLVTELQASLERLPKVSGAGQHFLSTTTNELLIIAFDEASQFKDEYVSTEHLLLALTSLSADPAAKLLAQHGVSRDARPLKRAIQRLIQDPLSMRILEGEVLPGDHVIVDADSRAGVMRFTLASARQEVAAD